MEPSRRIASLLADRKISQRELARRMGVRPSTVTDLLAGKSEPRNDTLAKAADALGTSFDYLKHGADEPAPASPAPKAPTEQSDFDRVLDRAFRAVAMAERMALVAGDILDILDIAVAELDALGSDKASELTQRSKRIRDVVNQSKAI